MGFFLESPIITLSNKGGASIDFLRRHACQVCPLSNQTGLRHPHMLPTGSNKPIIYILGEAPGAEEDAKGIQFIGSAGRTLRTQIPDKWVDKIRYNNCVRTMIPGNRPPTSIEIECCRLSIIKDVEETKPVAIFGMGNVPLWWAGISSSDSGITNWNGRHVPVKIGKHLCWFFPMMHPSFINRSRGQKRGQELEFTFNLDLHNAFLTIEKGLPDPIVHSIDDALSRLEIVRDYKRAIKLIKSMMFEPIVGLDIETSAHHAGETTARPYAKDARILTIGLSGKDYSFSFPLYHRENKWTEQQIKEVEDTFVRFLFKAVGRKVVHYLAFEMEWLAYFYGTETLRSGKWGCSNIQAYILDERPGTHSLGFLTMQYFSIDIKTIDNLDRKNLDKAPLDLVLRYNALDSKYHRFLYIEQGKNIKNKNLTKVYDHHLRRVPTMILTQLKGIPVDQETVKKFDDKYSVLLDDIKADIEDLRVVKKYREMRCKLFNPSSNNDVKWLINNILKNPIENTNESTLEKIDHPFIKLILEYRGVAKIYSTYIKPCMKGSPVLWPDGLIHSIISITTTRTGRTSSTDSNSQNWPKHAETESEGEKGGKLKEAEVRRQVKPGGDLRIVACDYAGIQARNVAMESQDVKLVKAFWEDYDIHADWRDRIASKWAKWAKGITSDKVIAKEKRQEAKNFFVFPTFFGAQAANTSGNLNIPKNIAEELREEFFNEFPEINKWHIRLNANYMKTGYVTGLSGFRRRAPISPNERVNSPIQADETIIVCDAMTRLSELGENRFQATMMIHDDLTFIWPKKDIERNLETVCKEMARISFPWINVPLVIEVSVGEDWYNIKEIGKYSSVELWNHKR